MISAFSKLYVETVSILAPPQTPVATHSRECGPELSQRNACISIRFLYGIFKPLVGCKGCEGGTDPRNLIRWMEVEPCCAMCWRGHDCLVFETPFTLVRNTSDDIVDDDAPVAPGRSVSGFVEDDDD